MTLAKSPKVQRERVLIILDMRHAERVRDAVVECRDKSMKPRTAPTEARLAIATAMALQAIFKRPEGWHDTEFRMALLKLVTPRLSRDELDKVMEAVYAVVPRREETDNIVRLRHERSNTTPTSKS